MAERTQDQILADVHENCEIRLALLGIIEKQRSVIAALLAVVTDIGFDPADFLEMMS